MGRRVLAPPPLVIIRVRAPRDIRHLPDVQAALAVEAGGIDIELCFEEVDPPVGMARAPDGVEAAFTGWMGLLEALSGLIAAQAATGDDADRLAPPS